MPPRKSKTATKEQPSLVSDTPVIFFLKIGDETRREEIVPAGEYISYSDILNSVEAATSSQRKFDVDLLKSVLDKVVFEKYNNQTACFWCCHTFVTTPCVLPKYYDSYKNQYIAEGHFCSPECALAYSYNDGKTSDSIKWTQHTLLELLYADVYRERCLSPAPPRSLLRLFGGPLDIAQYREYLSGDNNIVQSELPPIRLLFPSMSVQGPLRDIKKYVSLTPDVLEKASEQLRLKRTKPVNSNIPTLDMCINKK